MSTELTIGTEITTAVSTQIKNYVMGGDLQLPQNYSAVNALKSAMLQLPAILDASQKPVLTSCTRESIQNALLSMCIQGLNPDKKQCYFIAYGSKLTLTRSYFGDIAVAKQVDPTIEDIYSNVVFEGDAFDYEIHRGKIVSINHGQKLKNKDKPIVGAYATVVYKNGSEESTVMTIDQIKQSWKQSRTKPVAEDGTISKASTHGKYPEEMAKKTVVHKACKPIINNSSDSNLFTQFAKATVDEADAIEVEAEVEQNANKEELPIEVEAEIVDDVEPF